MSEYYFSEKVHHVNVGKEITILDEVNDEYFLLSVSQSSDLELFMEKGIVSSVSSVLLERGILNRYQGDLPQEPGKHSCRSWDAELDNSFKSKSKVRLTLSCCSIESIVLGQ